MFVPHLDNFGRHGGSVVYASSAHLQQVSSPKHPHPSAETEEEQARHAEEGATAHTNKPFFSKPRVRQYVDHNTRTIVREKEERKATFDELFYDLIFVATVAALGHSLAAHPTWTQFGYFCLFFTPVWYTWNASTIYINRFDTEDIAHKFFFFGQMLAVTVRVLDVFLLGRLDCC
jgi:Bacterial low temperature requirement A protein (LtrA)